MGRSSPGRWTGTPHWLAVVAVVLTCAALLLENLDGYHNDFGGNYRGEPPIINWTHGWPFIAVVRSSISRGSIRNKPLDYTSRWPIDDASVSRVYFVRLVIDLAIAFALVVGAGWAAQVWAMRMPVPNQFGLKTAFALLTLSAVITVVAMPLSRLESLRFILHYSALTIIAFALTGTLGTALLCTIRYCIPRRASHQVG